MNHQFDQIDTQECPGAEAQTRFDLPARARAMWRHVRPWAPGLVVLGLTFVVYLNSLGNGFVFYDRVTVAENDAIRHLADLGAILKESPSRPLFTLSLAVNYAVGGLDPFGYHLVNLLLHLIVVALVYVLVGLMVSTPDDEADGRLRWMPAIAAGLFGLHPVHTHTVNYISARSSLLAAMFFLAGVTLFALWSRTGAKHRLRWLALAGMYICFVLAMASNRTALTLPALVLVYDLAFVARCRIGALSRRWLVHAPLWLAAMARWWSLWTLKGGDIAVYLMEKQNAEALLGAPFTYITDYLRLLVLPVGLNVHHYLPEPVDTASIATYATWVAVWFVPTVIGFTFLLRRRTLGYGLLLTVWPLRFVMYEEGLYLPGVGFAIVSAWILARLLPKDATSWREAMQTVAGIAVVAVGLLYGGGTVYRNTVWRDEYRLWTDSLEKGPPNRVAVINLARAYTGRGMYYRALDLYRDAIELGPTDGQPYAGMGDVQVALGNFGKAAENYRRAIEVGPVLAGYYARLSMALEQMGLVEQAREANAAALERDPDHPAALAAEGQWLLADGNVDTAIERLERAVYLRPEEPQYHDQLGLAYVARGDAEPGLGDRVPWYTKALLEHKRAVELDPSSAESYYRYYNLANAYARLSRRNEAFTAYTKSIELNPTWPNAYVNLGGMLMETGQFDEAVKQFDRALQLDPSLVRARYNRASAWIQLGRIDSAIRELRLLVERAPELAPNCHLMIGQAYLVKRDTAQARAAFRAALDAQPGFPPAQAALDALDRTTEP